MSNIDLGADRTPHDLSHLVFSCGKMGRLMTLSAVPVIAGDSFSQDLVGSLRLSPLRRGLSVDSKVDVFTFYVPHRHILGDDWIEFLKEGVSSVPLSLVDNVTVGSRPTLSFLGINGSYDSGVTNSTVLPAWVYRGYQNIWNNYFKVPWDDDNTLTLQEAVDQDDSEYGFRCAYPKSIWTTPLPPERGGDEYVAPVSGSDASIDLLDLNQQYGALHSEQERQLFMQRYRDVVKSGFGGSTYYDADNRPQLKMRSSFWASGYDVDGTDQATLGQFTGRVIQSFKHSVPRCFVPEHGMMWTVALVRFPVLHDAEIHYFNGQSEWDYETLAGDPVIVGNHPPVEVTSGELFNGVTAYPLGIIPHSQWYRYHPPTIHGNYRSLQGYPFLEDFNFVTYGNLYVNSNDYNDLFSNEQLGHWNIQARNNVTCFRRLPTARDSAMTS